MGMVKRRIDARDGIEIALQAPHVAGGEFGWRLDHGRVAIDGAIEGAEPACCHLT